MASKKVRSIDAAQLTQVATVAQPDPQLEQIVVDDPRSSELSAPFVTRWSVLISTTNWEKGAIICAWREELESEGAPVTAYSDDAWSRRVGGVTSQHVGRLRRVYQRFGQSSSSYVGLYWTHFMSAVEWDDAEMWLEGALHSGWSVSQMRQTRWQANGGDPSNQPIDSDIVSATTDEDFSPTAEPISRSNDKDRDRDIATGPRYDEPDFGDEPNSASDLANIASPANSSGTTTADDDEADLPWHDDAAAGPATSPFAALPELPTDVADALEQFKLAIIRHRSSQWNEFSQANMLQTLDALRNFATL